MCIVGVKLPRVLSRRAGRSRGRSLKYIVCSTARISRGRFSVEAGRFLSKQGVSTTIKHLPSFIKHDITAWALCQCKHSLSRSPKLNIRSWDRIFFYTWTWSWLADIGAINTILYAPSGASDINLRQRNNVVITSLLKRQSLAASPNYKRQTYLCFHDPSSQWNFDLVTNATGFWRW